MIPKYHLQQLPPEAVRRLKERQGIAGDSRLSSAADAAAFVENRQVVALLGGGELPSVQEAAEGRLIARPPIGPAMGMGVAWEWAKELASSGKFVLTRIFRGKPAFVARKLWPWLVKLAPPDIEAALAAGTLSQPAFQIAALLRDHGPARTVDIKLELASRFPILPKSVQKGLLELEEKMLIYPLSLSEYEDGSEANTWELVTRGLAKDGRPPRASRKATRPLKAILEAMLAAAVVVDSSESRHWFTPWGGECRDIFAEFVKTSALCTFNPQQPSHLLWDVARKAEGESSSLKFTARCQ